MRDDLGLSQRFAQNAGDVVQLIAEFFAPGTVAKGISSASKIVGAAKFRSALGERFGLFKGDVSASKKEIGSSAQSTTQSLPVDQHAKVNQAPYDPRNAQGLASELLGSADFTRTTVPGYNMPNVRLAGRCKERTIVVNPETHETLVQRVVFDQRGFPIFDPYVKVETRISGDLASMLPEAHMRAATRQLREDILAGRVNGKMFTDLEWQHIQRGSERIGNYTWHHHQETGRMQLVPRVIHRWISHIGGNKIWGKE